MVMKCRGRVARKLMKQTQHAAHSSKAGGERKLMKQTQNAAHSSKGGGVRKAEVGRQEGGGRGVKGRRGRLRGSRGRGKVGGVVQAEVTVCPGEGRHGAHMYADVDACTRHITHGTVCPGEGRCVSITWASRWQHCTASFFSPPPLPPSLPLPTPCPSPTHGDHGFLQRHPHPASHTLAQAGDVTAHAGCIDVAGDTPLVRGKEAALGEGPGQRDNGRQVHGPGLVCGVGIISSGSVCAGGGVEWASPAETSGCGVGWASSTETGVYAAHVWVRGGISNRSGCRGREWVSGGHQKRHCCRGEEDGEREWRV